MTERVIDGRTNEGKERLLFVTVGLMVLECPYKRLTGKTHGSLRDGCYDEEGVKIQMMEEMNERNE